MSNEIKTADNSVLRLHRVGDDADYFRTYYRDTANEEYYVVINFHGLKMWHTAADNYAEPNMPLKDGLILEIEEDGRLLHREKIIRTGDCTSIGQRFD